MDHTPFLFRTCITVSMALSLSFFNTLEAQEAEPVQLVRQGREPKIDVLVGGRLFTSFLFPDSLEKPVLYPVITAGGNTVTRGYPIAPRPGDPTDHPHHLGIWFNFENLNGLDFWNNSFAIPAEKKSQYGWIKTNPDVHTTDGKKGLIRYTAKWTNQKNEVQVEEATTLQFSGKGDLRVIDRETTLAATAGEAFFKDAKDGMLAIRVTPELQIPSAEESKTFTDDKGNKTVVAAAGNIRSTGNYRSSEGLTGDAVWSTRAKWVQLYGRMGEDTVQVIIIDHPANPNYPTFWHARGYGLFAANPLGEKIFTKDQMEKNLRLRKGEKAVFRYRIVIGESAKSLSAAAIDAMAADFALQE